MNQSSSKVTCVKTQCVDIVQSANSHEIDYCEHRICAVLMFGVKAWTFVTPHMVTARSAQQGVGSEHNNSPLGEHRIITGGSECLHSHQGSVVVAGMQQ